MLLADHALHHGADPGQLEGCLLDIGAAESDGGSIVHQSLSGYDVRPGKIDERSHPRSLNTEQGARGLGLDRSSSYSGKGEKPSRPIQWQSRRENPRLEQPLSSHPQAHSKQHQQPSFAAGGCLEPAARTGDPPAASDRAPNALVDQMEDEPCQSDSP